MNQRYSERYKRNLGGNAMGIMDGMKSKGYDMNDDMDRMRMLTDKMNDGSITDAERDELTKMQSRPSTDAGM